MPLKPCKECGNEVSTEAKSCPKCGAKLPKKTSAFTWIVIALFSVFIFQKISTSDEPTAKLEPVAKTDLELKEEAARELRFQKTLSIVTTAKTSMRNPESVQWETIASNTDASVVCLKYRGKNGFGGTSIETATYANGKLTTNKDSFNRNCAGKSLEDMTYVSKAM